MSEIKKTYPCGCIRETVASGTPMAGTLNSYCAQHNPYKNVAPKVEIIK